jgi:hypothetical protein
LKAVAMPALIQQHPANRVPRLSDKINDEFKTPKQKRFGVFLFTA